MNVYILALIIALGINIAFFILANAFKTDKFTDFTYGLTFILLSFFFLLRIKSFYFYQVLLTGMITIWGLRLISYLLIRILKIKKDNRFNKIRKSSLEFFKFWFFQGLAVWFIMLPTIYLLSLRQTQNLTSGMTIALVLGAIIWLVGLVVETTADLQKFSFKNNPKNKGLWIQSGLWKYSRHPNYFGEMLLWWGIFVFVSPFIEGLYWTTIIGPMFISYILIFVTGIPPLEKRYDERYVDNKDYQEYKKKTSVLVPYFQRH